MNYRFAPAGRDMAENGQDCKLSLARAAGRSGEASETRAPPLTLFFRDDLGTQQSRKIGLAEGFGQRGDRRVIVKHRDGFAKL